MRKFRFDIFWTWGHLSKKMLNRKKNPLLATNIVTVPFGTGVALRRRANSPKIDLT
jgi:hypothetical protein